MHTRREKREKKTAAKRRDRLSSILDSESELDDGEGDEDVGRGQQRRAGPSGFGFGKRPH